MNVAVEQPRVVSQLSQRLTRNAITVQIDICTAWNGNWILVVVDEQQISHIWDESFDSDDAALAAAIRALDERPSDFVLRSGSAH